tara:strand:+ start:3414 stop:4037 length:624 start_codon:yes stop_codon:yes gene_type:complete
MHDIFFQNVLKAFIAIDPVALIPIFAILTTDLSMSKIIRLSIMVFLITTSILTFFLFYGNKFLNVMGIDLSSFQIVGGLFLFYISFEMVVEKRTKRKNELAKSFINDQELKDIAVFPLSIPLISGPSAITLSILISKDFTFNLMSLYYYLLPLIIILLLASLILIFSSMIINYCNETIINIFQKLFGIILGALSVQYIINGLREVFL